MNAFRTAHLVALAVALAACASPAPPTAAALNALANQAYFAGRYPQALEGYESARALAQAAGDGQYEAIATFGMARAQVQLCNFSAASLLFQDAIRQRSALPDVPFAKATQNLVEYARFLLAVERPQAAIPLMERAIPDLDAAGMATTDPIAYAAFYEDYAAALAQAGRDAAPALARAARLRSDNPAKVARFKPTPLPTGCRSG